MAVYENARGFIYRIVLSALIQAEGYFIDIVLLNPENGGLRPHYNRIFPTVEEMTPYLQSLASKRYPILYNPHPRLNALLFSLHDQFKKVEVNFPPGADRQFVLDFFRAVDDFGSMKFTLSLYTGELHRHDLGACKSIEMLMMFAPHEGHVQPTQTHFLAFTQDVLPRMLSLDTLICPTYPANLRDLLYKTIPRCPRLGILYVGNVGLSRRARLSQSQPARALVMLCMPHTHRARRSEDYKLLPEHVRLLRAFLLPS